MGDRFQTERTELRIAQLVADTSAEGPGRRWALWLQGCPLRCPGCCNPDFLPERGGSSMTIDELTASIPDGVEGISLLGGEPFAQAEGCAGLAQAARARGLGIMIFSGYTLAELRAQPGSQGLLGACDLLVDGRYRRELPEPQRRWVGSRNQVMHFLSERYQPEDPSFSQANTVELRLDARGTLTVNGWPAASRVLP